MRIPGSHIRHYGRIIAKLLLRFIVISERIVLSHVACVTGSSDGYANVKTTDGYGVHQKFSAQIFLSVSMDYTAAFFNLMDVLADSFECIDDS